MTDVSFPRNVILSSDSLLLQDCQSGCPPWLPAPRSCSFSACSFSLCFPVRASYYRTLAYPPSDRTRLTSWKDRLSTTQHWVYETPTLTISYILMHKQFQKVFALALPDRADRTVPLLDAANATNITLTVLDAVRDEQIAQDSWPPDWAKYRQPERGELGCFISYLRTWKK